MKHSKTSKDPYRLRDLQLVLGVDQRHSYFEVLKDPAATNLLCVYYGMKLVEKVPDDKRDPQYRLLLARLVNAGARLSALHKAFGIDPKTLKTWGAALVSKNRLETTRVLFGLDLALQKRELIHNYVCTRFPEVYTAHRRNYSQIMRQEIAQTFGVKLTGESLRKQFTPLRIQWHIDRNPIPENPANQAQISPHNEESSCDLPAPSLPELAEDSMAPAAPVASISQPARSAVPSLLSHAGVLLFAPIFSTLRSAFTECPQVLSLLKLFLTFVLLGAVNLEQSKLLHRNSLQFLLGTQLFTLNRLRKIFKTLAADPAVLAAVFAANLSLTPQHEREIFYFDPHGKEYTGAKKILKGYFTGMRTARKVVHADFFHTKGGRPVYFEHADNFDDMRARFREVLPRFRAMLGVTSEQSLTFVIDRAIFSKEMFNYFLESDTANQLITWEKGYKKGEFDPKRAIGEYVLMRPRNHSHDLLRYTFSYYEEPWDKNLSVRRLLVQLTAPGDHKVEVVILCTDATRSAEEVIELMFSRWVQENDFGYLIKHFGLDEIISYSAISYQELRDLVTDRNVKSMDYKLAMGKKYTTENELKDLLLKQHKKPRSISALQTSIDEKSREVEQLTQAMQAAEKEESRLERLLEDGYSRLDTSSKTLMDAIKILAHNIFYLALSPFREQYENYRDDHTLFRHLSRCPGIAWVNDEQVSVVLMPDMHLPRKTRQVVEEVLTLINAQNPVMMDGSDKPIKLLLAPKTSKRKGLKKLLVEEPE